MPTYDPKQVKVFFGSLILHGFMDGTMIQVAQDEDTYMKHTGADGEVCRIRNRNEGGKITITLQQSSPSNDDLSALHALDKLSGFAQAPVMVKDLRGTLLVSASEAWLTRFADVSLGKEIEGREWTIDCAQLKVVSVGSAVV